MYTHLLVQNLSDMDVEEVFFAPPAEEFCKRAQPPMEFHQLLCFGCAPAKTRRDDDYRQVRNAA